LRPLFLVFFPSFSGPDAEREWAEALLAAALDETGGDPRRALELAKAEHSKEPAGEG
jgi:hypothetical protein